MSVWPIHLVEGQPLELAANALTDDEAVAIQQSGVAEVEFPSPLNKRRYRLFAIGRIGHVPVGPGMIVSVQPKASIASVFRLLERVYGLKSFKFHDGWTDLESVAETFERLAHVFARRVLHRVRVGLYREYVAESAALQRVRGRVDAVRTALSVSRGAVVVHCHYTEQTEDVEDNTILLWTLRCLLRAGLQREEVRLDLRQAYRALAGTISERPATVADCLKRSYHRLNQDYALLHALCALFLSAIGPDVRVGDMRMLPFELNMANLYEQFVASWLAERLAPVLTVHPHRRIDLVASETFRLDVDIVISDPTTGQTLCVIDTKYKTAPRPSTDDFNQVVVYAAGLGARHAVLAYPYQLESPFFAVVNEIEVRAMTFNLALSVEEAGRQFLRQLMSLPALKPYATTGETANPIA